MLDRTSTELPVGDSRKLDPTGTSGIRAAFRRSGKLRLRQLRAALRNAVVGNDLLGLSKDSVMRYHATSTRLAALSNSLEVDADRLLCCDWFMPHLQKAWRAGFDTAAREMNAEMMWSPSVSDKLNEMVNREIRGIVAAIVQQVTRAAAKLLTRRGHKVKAWRALLPPFDKVGELRIALLADTMTVMAYNEAKLEVYGAAGVKQVGVNPEWLPSRKVRDAFDPSEERDPHGRWTSGGGAEVESQEKFKHWFGGSKVVDKDGRPLVVYHGSLSTFSQFEKSKPESDWGAAMYFSSTPVDINKYYATSTGPDVLHHIGARARELQQEHSGMSRERAEALAHTEIVRHQGAIIPVFLKMEHPFVVGGKDQTWLDYNDDNYTGALTDFIAGFLGTEERDHAKLEKLAKRGVIPQETLDTADGLIGAALDQDGISATELEGFVRDAHANASELLQRGLIRAGFDGVIDHTVSDKFQHMPAPEGTAHYVVFESTQIKSAISSKYSPDKPGIGDALYDPELKVGVRTAGDNRVCIACEDYAAGAPYELEDVEMTLPLHPRCRCSWYPWRDRRFKHD